MKKSTILCLIFLGAAFLLRVWGISFGLPFFTHPDERHYLPKAVAMFTNSDLNPHYFLNPPFLTYVYTVLTGIYGIFWKIAGFWVDLPDFRLMWKTDPTSFYLFARFLTGIFGTATCWLVFRIGNMLFRSEVGLLASGILATAFLHVRDSHYAVNDVLSVFLLTWSFLLMVDISLKAKTKRYWQAGLVAGLAVATKYNTGLIVVVLPVAHFLGHPGDFRQQVDTMKLPMIFGITAVVGFMIACPWILLDATGFWEGFFKQAQMAASPWMGGSTENSYVQFLKTLLWGYGFLPFVLSLFGLARLAQSLPRIALLVGLFPLVYLGLMGQSKLFFVRFTLPMFPFLSLLTAYGIWSLLKQGERRQISLTIATIMVMLVIAQGAVLSIQHNLLLTRKDSRIIADEWIRQNIPAGSRIIRQGYCPWIENDLSGQLPRNYEVKDVWAKFNRAHVDEFRKDGWHHILTSDYMRKRFEDKPDDYPNETEFYRSLDRDANELFASDVCKRDITFYLDDVYSPFWTLFRVIRPGPCVRVYQL